MSGHSKWSTIKHKKGKSDAAKANVFTKIGREIAVAVKSGGADPSLNAKLYDVIQKARKNNMPNDKIQNGIKKASGELASVNYEELTYEGYGVGGIAVIVETLTDNKNRTGGDVRWLFDKFKGNMGSTGCVSFMFDRKGVIIVNKDGIDFDTLMDYAIECGADDVEEDDDIFEVTTSLENFSEVNKFLTEKKLNIENAEIEWVPQNLVTLADNDKEVFFKMLDRFEELDDVQNVWHNLQID